MDLSVQRTIPSNKSMNSQVGTTMDLQVDGSLYREVSSGTERLIVVHLVNS